MPISRWEKVIARANSLEPDLNLLLGDYTTQNKFVTAIHTPAEVAKSATQLQSKLGTYAICGNHDWWEDKLAQSRHSGPTNAQIALEAEGIPVLENRAMRLEHEGNPFWLSGTASIVAIWHGLESRAELGATLAQVTDDAPIIHLAHEPDLFAEMPERVSLTLSGHTHGGQVRVFGYSPVVPSAFGNRYAYGHIIENGRHLVVSGGLGCSILPLRIGMPPEITVLELG